MKILPLIAFTAIALGHGTRGEQPAATQPTPPQASSQAGSASAVHTLADAECIAIADYMRRAERATMAVWSGDWFGETKLSLAAIQAIAEESTEGMPDDFRRYMEDYCALLVNSLEKLIALNGELNSGNRDDSFDVMQKIRKAEQQLRDDKLALSARYYRASLLGSDWERRVYDRAKSDLHLAHPRAKAFIEANPVKENQKPDNLFRVAAYLIHLSGQPAAEHSAAEARRELERQEILRQLDPNNRVESARTFYGVREGTVYAVRLPQEASTGCTWQLAEPPADDSKYTIEWQTVPTQSLRKPKPHGEASAATPLPDTRDTTVATVCLKKAGTVILRFICTREGDDAPLATKPITFYVRHANDFRPLMETEPMPEPEPMGPPPAPGVDKLTDAECLALDRYLQRVYCYTCEECAKAVERQEHLQVPVILGGALPTVMLFDAPKIPKDFEMFQVEHHHHYIGIRAASRALDRKEYNYRYGKEITKEQRRELREDRVQIEKRKADMWKMLEEKYPRAIILRNADALVIMDEIYRSYNNTDADAKRFFAENPEMRDATTKLAKAAFFRYLAAERNKEEQTVAAARRRLERLDALRPMKVVLDGEEDHHFYGMEGGDASAVILPFAPETGFSWKLETPLAEDSPVEVVWTQMNLEKLVKLKDMDLIRGDLPKSPQVMIASIRMKKAGQAKLRFICTRPGDDEPLLSERAEVEVHAKEND